MPRTATNRSKRGCAQERGKPSHARRGKELDRKKKEAQQRENTRRKKVHARERDSMCMCKKVLKINGKKNKRAELHKICKKL